MNNKFLRGIVVLSTIFISALPAYSEDTEELTTIVVTANRGATPENQVGSSYTVIHEDEIKKSGATEVLDILRTVPGLNVVRSGGPGGNTSVYLRGANSEHTLVLIDGIEANNPAITNRSFNFSDLVLENVERIEVIRGPQSNLYGSDAIGGVIAIFTKKGEGPLSAYASSEAGSYETFIQKAGVSGGEKLFNYSFGFTREDIGSVSAASEADGNTEDDRRQNTGFSARLGVTPVDNFDADIFFRYNNSDNDIDNGGGVGGDDPNRTFDNEQLFWRAQGALELFEGKTQHVFGVSVTDQTFEDDNDPDPAHPLDFQRSTFNGEMIKVDLVNTIHISDSNTFVVGLETEEEKASSEFRSDGSFGPFESVFAERDVRTNGYFVEDQIVMGNFATSLGLRVDDHSIFGSQTTWRVAPALIVPEFDAKLKASAGTGYKAPSLFQLYSDFGSEDLQPEESFGFDAGFEKYIADTTVGAAFFYNEIEELISFDPNTFIFENINEAETLGFEVFVEAELGEDLIVRADFTYTDTEDKDTGEELLRRPRSKASLMIDYALCDKSNIYFVANYVGSRDDLNFSSFPEERVELGSYTTFNVAASYQVHENVELTARVDNILDREYSEVYGFGALGIGAYGGIRVTL